MSQSRARLLTISLCLATALAACGSGDDPTVAVPTTDGAATVPCPVEHPASRGDLGAEAVGVLVGGTLAAGSANTFNSVYDRDIDAIMRRTFHRPAAMGIR